MFIKQYLFLSLIFFMTDALPQNILPKDAKLEKVFDKGIFTEGPAEAPDGSIFFSDLTFDTDEIGNLLKYNPKTGETIIYRSPSGKSNGNKFDADGNLISALGSDFGLRCIIKTDLSTGKSKMLAGLFEDKYFNSPNDLVIDKKGNIYFTDPDYAYIDKPEQPVSGVYKIDKRGKVSLLIKDIKYPNGIAISPDQKTLYVGCYDEGDGVKAGRMTILKYKLDNDSSAAFIKVLKDFAPKYGPDGIAVDEKGNIYAAVREESKPGIYVFNQAGEQIEFIATPEVPSNLTFSKLTNYLYITAEQSLYRIKVNNKGIFN